MNLQLRHYKGKSERAEPARPGGETAKASGELEGEEDRGFCFR
jgi:hypothetical protein